MIRRVSREVVLQSLFQIDFSGCGGQQALEAALAERNAEVAEKARDYAAVVLNGVLGHLQEIDALLGRYAIDWTVERMPATDRNILRVAVYEMLFAEDKIAPGVAINEAVEISKCYGTEDSPRFINGILGKIVR